LEREQPGPLAAWPVTAGVQHGAALFGASAAGGHVVGWSRGPPARLRGRLPSDEPRLVLAAGGLRRARPSQAARALRGIALGALLVLGVYSRWWEWWGGACYGPRMLADLTPLLAYAIHPCVALL